MQSIEQQLKEVQDRANITHMKIAACMVAGDYSNMQELFAEQIMNMQEHVELEKKILGIGK